MRRLISLCICVLLSLSLYAHTRYTCASVSKMDGCVCANDESRAPPSTCNSYICSSLATAVSLSRTRVSATYANASAATATRHS